MKKIFSKYNFDEFCGIYNNRISFLNTIQKLNYVPQSLIVFNGESKTDSEHQYKPFLQLAKINNIDLQNIEYLIYNDVEAGHNAISKEKNVKLINAYLNKYLI